MSSFIFLYSCQEKTKHQSHNHNCSLLIVFSPMLDQMEVDDSCRRTHKRHASSPDTLPWGGTNHLMSSYQNGSWEDSSVPPKTRVANPNKPITMSLKRLLRDHEQLYEL